MSQTSTWCSVLTDRGGTPSTAETNTETRKVPQYEHLMEEELECASLIRSGGSGTMPAASGTKCHIMAAPSVAVEIFTGAAMCMRSLCLYEPSTAHPLLGGN